MRKQDSRSIMVSIDFVLSSTVLLCPDSGCVCVCVRMSERERERARAMAMYVREYICIGTQTCMHKNADCLVTV